MSFRNDSISDGVSRFEFDEGAGFGLGEEIETKASCSADVGSGFVEELLERAIEKIMHYLQHFVYSFASLRRNVSRTLQLVP
jgi:hypothetical protein